MRWLFITLVVVVVAVGGCGRSGVVTSVPVSALPKTSAHLKAGKPTVIVCIGSSSTEGFGASSPENSYPSLLANKLTATYGAAVVNVLNKGVGGNTMSEMIARFHSDVLVYDPHLVILQTGTMEAIQKISIDRFIENLEIGVSALSFHDIEILLVEPQYYPGYGESEEYFSYIQAMRIFATGKRIPIVPRYDLIKEEILAGNSDVLFSDNFHLSDKGYDLLSSFIFQMLR